VTQLSLSVLAAFELSQTIKQYDGATHVATSRRGRTLLQLYVTVREQ